MNFPSLGGHGPGDVADIHDRTVLPGLGTVSDRLQPPDERSRVHGRRSDRHQLVVERVQFVERRHGKLGEPEDRRETVVEVVNESRGEFPDGTDPLGARDLVLGFTERNRR